MKTILVDAGKTFVVNGHLFTPIYELLEQYNNKKIILSNANDEEILNGGLIDLPYELFTLKHDPDKNNPMYFDTLFKKFNLKPEDCVYFDHVEEAVKSADSVGVKSYYYDSEKKDLAALKFFLDKNLLSITS